MIGHDTEGALQAVDQCGFIKRLAQKTNRSGTERALPRFFFGKCGYEDDGHRVPVGEELALQLKAVEARHLEIGDQTRRCREEFGIKEMFRGVKCRSVIPERLDEVSNRLSHDTIVIDNGDGCHMGHPAKFPDSGPVGTT